MYYQVWVERARCGCMGLVGWWVWWEGREGGCGGEGVWGENMAALIGEGKGERVVVVGGERMAALVGEGKGERVVLARRECEVRGWQR